MFYQKEDFSIKSLDDIKTLKEGGKILSRILKKVASEVKPNVSAKYLDDLAYKLIKESGGEPAFLNYQPDFAKKPFPFSLCVSINEVVVHGLPLKEVIIKEGDIVSLDLGLKYKNLYTDMALTVGVGKIKPIYKKMMKVCYNALMKAVKIAKVGNTLGDIGWAIESYTKKNGFVVIRDLVGHGVGYKPHEDPLVYNYGEKGKGLILKEGMVLAIEPMITIKSGLVKENLMVRFQLLMVKLLFILKRLLLY